MSCDVRRFAERKLKVALRLYAIFDRGNICIEIALTCRKNEGRGNMRWILALGMALITGSAMAAGSSVGHGNGAATRGDFREFVAIVQQYNQSGEQFRIRGRCKSACTMFLSIRNVCIEPSAILLFHSVGNRSVNGSMFGSYNSALNAYLTAHGANQPNQPFVEIPGSQMMSKFGYKRCP